VTCGASDFPFADGDGVIKAAPEPAIAFFRLVGRSHDELLQRYDGRMTVGIKERLAVRAVIEEKRSSSWQCWQK